eukprot:scaffold407_cov251-Pinguiococcus_pyrenoidosus.AAC.11
MREPCGFSRQPSTGRSTRTLRCSSSMGGVWRSRGAVLARKPPLFKWRSEARRTETKPKRLNGHGAPFCASEVRMGRSSKDKRDIYYRKAKEVGFRWALSP